MKTLPFNCSQCPMPEKICRFENGKGPQWCPTKKEKKILSSAMKEYRDPETIEAGKLADLILINGDPLEDMKLFQQYQEKITLITQEGRVCNNIL
ncbi:MAG: hypothetical protein A2156_15650 [Deltaproteobacteria bacterium RBG_16_48_10]|nr:MAG: hypothetical protein A2156_15650 [Deltaproteobacteria bacterium RBG_16_48_10]